MPLTIKTKQVAGVTLIVGLTAVLLSGWYISQLTAVWLGETQARAALLADAIIHRAFDVVQSGADPVTALQQDPGLRSILEASLYSANVQYAGIVNRRGQIIADIEPDMVGRPERPADDLTALVADGSLAQARAIYTPRGRSYEFRKPLLIDNAEFGSVRVGVSTLLIKQSLTQQLRAPLATAALAMVLASLVAMVLAQIALRPIHVLRGGLARLGRGEVDVDLEMPGDAELAELGDSFRAVSARLTADRELAGQRATLASVVEHLEDGVALFDPQGALLFANPAMKPALGDVGGAVDRILPAGHPYRQAVAAVISEGRSLDPVSVDVPGIGKRLLVAHAVEDADGHDVGVMLVVRNLAYLSQVESTLSYSRKLAALSRISAGIAHEVKNPLNATMIHLELLRMQLADQPDALEHVSVIAAQLRRLDEVVQGFLKFTRPEDLQLQPVSLPALLETIRPVIAAEAGKSGVDVRIELPADLPRANADPAMLEQAFLNLALNACQAMPDGGRLRVTGGVTPRHDIEVRFEDTGVGIPPEQLARIFDLYFTTKEQGSGIGLSLVYRTVQLHDGQIEVQSVPGRGTTFRLLLRQAPAGAHRPRLPASTLGLRDLESV